jgi:hypothetical protein
VLAQPSPAGSKLCHHPTSWRPNARHQARRAAGATRRLSAVACMPLLAAAHGLGDGFPRTAARHDHLPPAPGALPSPLLRGVPPSVFPTTTAPPAALPAPQRLDTRTRPGPTSPPRLPGDLCLPDHPSRGRPRPASSRPWYPREPPCSTATRLPLASGVESIGGERPANAALQAPPIAGATQERRLLAVACKRLFGLAFATDWASDGLTAQTV